MSYTPKHRFFRIFVPKSPGTLIAPRSAIVAKDPLTVHDGRITVYYEGNLLGAENLHEFVQRLNSAAGRCSESYPTTARALLNLSDLVDVGCFDLATGEVTNLYQPEALIAWLDGESLPDIGPRRFLLSTVEADETLYWSNEWGWGSRSEAEVFTSKELASIYLPLAAGPIEPVPAFPTDGRNPLAAPLDTLIAELQAIRQYAADLVGTGTLPDELEHHIASEYADERLEKAIEALRGHTHPSGTPE